MKSFRYKLKIRAKPSLFYTLGNNITHHESFFAEYLDSFGIIANTQTCVLSRYQ